MDGQKSPGKSFEISKQEVWDAYEVVKANKGAAGVDEVSVAAFDEDLKNNLYKIWNRMSSGTYFPPPVRAVEIPKADGGVRVLGIPTRVVYRAVAQACRGFGVVRHGHTPVPPDVGAAAAGAV